MAKGQDTGEHPGRKVHKERWEIGKHSIGESGDRVVYHLTGGGYDPRGSLGHGAQRFGSHEEALSYVSRNNLELKTPASGLPPSDAGDVGYSGKKRR